MSKLLSSECSIIDLDKIAHEILLPTCSYGVYNDVVKAFGSGILDEDGAINRTALGGVIFKDAKERRKLNGITHPRIRYRMLREMLVRKVSESLLDMAPTPLLLTPRSLFRHRSGRRSRGCWWTSRYCSSRR